MSLITTIASSDLTIRADRSFNQQANFPTAGQPALMMPDGQKTRAGGTARFHGYAGAAIKLAAVGQQPQMVDRILEQILDKTNRALFPLGQFGGHRLGSQFWGCELGASSCHSCRNYCHETEESHEQSWHNDGLKEVLLD